MKSKGLAAIMAGAVAMLLFSISPSFAGNNNPGVMPPGASPYGKTYANWSAEWWQWVMAIPADKDPVHDTTGQYAATGQSGPVFFLAGTGGGPVERTVTIPPGKALFFPLINIVNDYPCPDPTFQPAEGQSMEEFLTEGANFYIDHVTAMSAEIDGIPVKNLWDYRATSSLFYFAADVSWAAFDPCVTGELQPGVADGYWLMLAPLKPGQHTIKFFAEEFFPEWDWTFTVEVTYHLNVLKK